MLQNKLGKNNMTSYRVQRGAFHYENPSIWPESEQESKNHFEIKVMNIIFFVKQTVLNL